MGKIVNITFGILLLLCSGCHPKQGGSDEPNTDPQPQPSAEGVMTYVSTADNTMHFETVSRNFKEGLNMDVEKTLYLKPEQTYQQFDGFGIALNGSACYNLMQMAADQRHDLLVRTFDVEKGMGYSATRISIGASDFSLSDYTCWDNKDKPFALTAEETEYVIPVLKEVLAINPTIQIMGSPWTCPRWMKVNNLTDKQPYTAWNGGYLNPNLYEEYASYFVNWIQAFETAGVPIASITIQNEPLNWGNSESLYMEWKQQRDFVKVLGPAVRNAGLQTKIIVFDHNYNYDGKADQQQYPLKIYNDATAAQYIDGAAYHNYGGNSSELDVIHKGASTKNLYFTEASIGTWNYRSYGQSFLDIADNVCFQPALRWCKSSVMWNFMLDNHPEEGPYRPGGCSTCYGAVQIDYRDYSSLMYRSTYYVMGQMSKVLRTGSTRIGTSGYLPSGVQAVASANPDGTYGLVLFNKSLAAVKMVVDDGQRAFELTLPAESLTSCLWKITNNQ